MNAIESFRPKTDYQHFLASDFWKALRVECFRRDKWTCRLCGSGVTLECHHATYPRNWYLTTLDHLTTLCHQCHSRHHGKIVSPPKQLKPIRAKRPKKPSMKFKANWQTMSDEEYEIRCQRTRGEITRAEFKARMKRLNRL